MLCVLESSACHVDMAHNTALCTQVDLVAVAAWKQTAIGANIRKLLFFLVPVLMLSMYVRAYH